ncbi:MAG: FecR domain-containing protein [Desulfobacterales bacterium]|nr:MAG: FecR domain-containing protein [Desulfobacterales bacterium]
MVLKIKKIILTLIISLFLVFLKYDLAFTQAFPQPMLPEDVPISEIYQAGPGLPVGKIQSVWGSVAVIHADMTCGYQAKIGLPLFEGDTIITLGNGSTGCKLNDGSVIRIAPNSKLSIIRSAHDSKRKSSISSVSLPLGKAFFKITKLEDFEPREFKVTTDTVVVGARQADFMLLVTEEINEIIVMEGADLEITSVEDPEQKILLSELQRAVIEEGMLPSTIEMMPPEDANLLAGEFLQVPAGPLPEILPISPGAGEPVEDIWEEEIEIDINLEI